MAGSLRFHAKATPRAGAQGGGLRREAREAGFVDVEILNREPLSVGDCALYPLFTDEVIRLMRKLIPADRQPEVAISVVVRASLPAP